MKSPATNPVPSRTQPCLAGHAGFHASRFCLLPSALAALLLAHPATGSGADAPPNFALIVADDLGYSDIGCYGARFFRTPNLDRMAAEGLRMTDFYVPASVCSPSRAALMTGRYPDRTGVTADFSPTLAGDGQPAGPGKSGLHPDEITLAEILKEKGYATACIGKWHLGDGPDFLPTRQGFDSYLGIPYSNDMGWWEGRPREFQEDFPPIPLLENENAIEISPDQRYLTRRYTERSVEFIRSHRNRPFFLYLSHSMPHVPLFVSEEFSGSAEYGLYGDVIQELDWSVGEILKALAECGLDDNTLVIFTSDNGPWLAQGAHGGKADPLRDGKFTRYEGGHRVPCILRWPGRLREGPAAAGLASTIDLLPTFAALAGAETPSDRKIDGLNLWPYLSGEVAQSPRDHFFYSQWVLRRGKYKLLMPGAYVEVVPPPRSPDRNGQAKYQQSRLFDLEKDIGETSPLPAEKEFQEIIKEMTEMCRAYREEIEGDDGVFLKR